MTKFISWGVQWQPQMRNLLLCSLSSSEKFNISCSVLLSKCLMPPGPAYNCTNVFIPPPKQMNQIFHSGNLISPPPTSIHLHSEHPICIANLFLFYLCDSVGNLFFDLTPHLTVSLRGESGPQGHRFRCCLRSLWQSSGEMRQLS